MPGGIDIEALRRQLAAAEASDLNNDGIATDAEVQYQNAVNEGRIDPNSALGQMMRSTLSQQPGMAPTNRVETNAPTVQPRPPAPQPTTPQPTAPSNMEPVNRMFGRGGRVTGTDSDGNPVGYSGDPTGPEVYEGHTYPGIVSPSGTPPVEESGIPPLEGEGSGTPGFPPGTALAGGGIPPGGRIIPRPAVISTEDLPNPDDGGVMYPDPGGIPNNPHPAVHTPFSGDPIREVGTAGSSNLPPIKPPTSVQVDTPPMVTPPVNVIEEVPSAPVEPPISVDTEPTPTNPIDASENQSTRDARLQSALTGLMSDPRYLNLTQEQAERVIMETIRRVDSNYPVSVDPSKPAPAGPAIPPGNPAPTPSRS